MLPVSLLLTAEGRLFHSVGLATTKDHRPYRSMWYRVIVNTSWRTDLSDQVGEYGVASEVRFLACGGH